MSLDEARLQAAFLRLSEVMAALRVGCPWDKAQTHESLRRFLLEECYEVLEALDARDDAALCGELGDLLFQIWFHAEVASERAGAFDLSDVVEAICSKLVRRHPHVFAQAEAADADAVKKNWEQIKLDEGRKSVLEGVPKALPALLEAQVIQSKASAIGFDWPEIAGVVEKLREEIEELAAEVDAVKEDEERRRAIEHELGDLLFSVVNVSRHLGHSAEDALRCASARFRRRFVHVEDAVRNSERSMDEVSLEELDRFWGQAKMEEG